MTFERVIAEMAKIRRSNRGELSVATETRYRKKRKEAWDYARFE